MAAPASHGTCPVPSERLRQTADRLIRDAIAHYPGCRVAAAGLSYADATTVHRLIQTAHLTIRLTEETQP